MESAHSYTESVLRGGQRSSYLPVSHSRFSPWYAPSLSISSSSETTHSRSPTSASQSSSSISISLSADTTSTTTIHHVREGNSRKSYWRRKEYRLENRRSFCSLSMARPIERLLKSCSLAQIP